MSSAADDEDLPDEGPEVGAVPTFQWMIPSAVRAAQPRPIVMATTIVFAMVVILGAVAGTSVVSFAIGVVSLLLALGWGRLLGLPDPAGSAVIIAVVAILAAVAVAISPAPVRLQWLPVVVAAGLILALVRELMRRDGRPRLVESVSGTFGGVVMATSGTPLVALAVPGHYRAAVTMSMSAVIASVLVDGFGYWPVLRRWTMTLGIVAGALTSWAVHVLAAHEGHTAWQAVIVGAVIAAISAVIRRTLAGQSAVHGVRCQFVVASASILVVGFPSYVFFTSLTAH